MVIFEQVVNLGDSEVINDFESMDLFFKHDALMTSDFVFIDDVDCTGHC